MSDSGFTIFTICITAALLVLPLGTFIGRFIRWGGE